MMLRRAWPRPARPFDAAHTAWASGPRCTRLAAARASPSEETRPRDDTDATIPHIRRLYQVASCWFRVAGCSTLNAEHWNPNSETLKPETRNRLYFVSSNTLT